MEERHAGLQEPLLSRTALNDVRCNYFLCLPSPPSFEPPLACSAFLPHPLFFGKNRLNKTGTGNRTFCTVHIVGCSKKGSGNEILNRRQRKSCVTFTSTYPKGEIRRPPLKALFSQPHKCYIANAAPLWCVMIMNNEARA